MDIKQQAIFEADFEHFVDLYEEQLKAAREKKAERIKEKTNNIVRRDSFYITIETYD